MADRKPATIAAQADHYIGAELGELVPPIHPSTNFARGPDYALINPAHDYIRDDNPTFLQAERVLAKLEGGVECMLFASGMAAMSAVLDSLRAGDHIAAPAVMYYGTLRWLRSFAERRGFAATLFDAADPAALAKALRPGETRILWIETPVNPTWDLIDIEAAARAAHDAGALLVVDSTVATPVLTRPIAHGADLVVHSATKYLNGHGDVAAGAVVARQGGEALEAIRFARRNHGGIVGSFEAWLLLRGMRTLFVRIERASASALAIAQHFERHPKLERVLYPGLPSHPGHDIARRQMAPGYGGMLSILVAGGAEAALAAAGRLECFIRATSLGGVESLVEHRASIEGPDSLVPPSLLRLSVGLEDVGDLIADLEGALSAL